MRAIRGKSSGVVRVEDFLQEFKLSSREGLAIMALAESLARAPDNPTADLLLADKLAAGDFSTLIDEIEASGYGLTPGLHTRIESRIAELAARAPAGNSISTAA